MPEGHLPRDELVAGGDDRASRSSIAVSLAGVIKHSGSRAHPILVKLADRVAQCRVPFTVHRGTDGCTILLNNAADCAKEVAGCPLRFVLTDDLTRLCTALAYSKGARSLACGDLLRVPGESVWIEWCNEPWQTELQEYGLTVDAAAGTSGGRRGVLLRASCDGRRGMLRSFWSTGTEPEVLASSIEAYFDLDTAAGHEPDPHDAHRASSIRIVTTAPGRDDVLSRCFRFRYEHSWSNYYAQAALTPRAQEALWRHALGTTALDVPVVLAFLLLLATRTGLPQAPQRFERLNRSRARAGKAHLLDHIEVSAPLEARYGPSSVLGAKHAQARGARRLHHVRGHLVRRGSQIFWRVPHLRGSARAGTIRSRTVIWTLGR